MKRQSQVDALIEEARSLAETRDVRGVAQDLVRGLPEGFLRRLAVEFIVERVRGQVRQITLAAERRAMREQLMHELTTSGPPPGRRVRRSTEEAAEAEEARANAFANMAARVGVLVSDYVESARIQWTQDLLDSPFSLADGTQVLWGDATVDQHRERLAIFTRNAAANIEGAARHKAALEALSTTGAPTLREMVTAA